MRQFVMFAIVAVLAAATAAAEPDDRWSAARANARYAEQPWFVDGKSHTIYPWESWGKEFRGEPLTWHHDMYRASGDPYRAEQIAYIREVTSRD